MSAVTVHEKARSAYEFTAVCENARVREMFPDHAPRSGAGFGYSRVTLHLWPDFPAGKYEIDRDKRYLSGRTA